jgi:hypothetical protein
LVDIGALTLMRISEIYRSPLRDIIPRSWPTPVHRSNSPMVYLHDRRP